MKAYGGVELGLRSFLNSTLDETECLKPWPPYSQESNQVHNEYIAGWTIY